ncbi:alpha-(1,3)-fucosyltransferase C-like [Pecten maximus]|uniref:alpha-(1,3)-fucosyltransferase C-like n=1 Tax=Pecten maximus TaxID=6579 RepID=UPI001458708C|nr:alpha-(1,3)-fucosyltransferase C-like [Pecten maximus]
MTWGVDVDMSTSDAVIFQGPSLGYTYPRPPKKTRGQVWILHGSESPVYWRGSLSKWRGLFNLTMAYRRDADIRHSYGDFRKRPNVLSNITNDSPKPSSNNPVSWFVTHCTTSSKREVFIKQLSKYIKIDIYGACGQLKCPLSKDKECLNKYKFYLAFENSICTDYITEKVFKVYQTTFNTIPVVRGFKGQASMFLPPGSYISTDDFSSPRELGKFIEKTSKNITAFQRYFQWKHFYESFSYETNPFCELCRKLHRPESYRRLYYDIEAWLKGENEAVCGRIDDV